ncbi:hypothetical protein [Actinoplanes utahensis]|uniref:hypothetical protein n=1 Tax=Actinoplanes utahensis TaxID=1869 RepID=UPI00126A72AC|nr:hypothetical protein [Actinoplanes utahensis]
MTDGAVRPSLLRHAGKPASWRRAVRALLAAAWVVWLVSSWWAAPRETDLARARADVAAGRVQSYQRGDTWSDATSFSWNRHASLRSWGTDGPLLVWRTTDGRLHYTVTDVVSGTEPDEPGVGLTPMPPLARELDAAGVERSDPIGPLTSLTAVSTVLIIVFLAILRFGPVPVAGTRWFWFWLVVGVPLGFGFVYWLLRERPWTSAAGTIADAAGDVRRRWYVGFAISFVATLGGSLLAYGLHRLLGEWMIPSTLIS